MTFLATLKQREALTHPKAERATHHLVLDIEGSGIEYKVGDCVTVFPDNDPQEVEKILSACNATGDEEVVDRKGKPFVFKELLLSHANLSRSNFKGSAEEIAKTLPPLLPRYYSIASAQSEVGNEVHLTVADTGLCSNYLCERAPLNAPCIRIGHHATKDFTLPKGSETKPLIMIGPGTGVAPFRGFMQHRLAQQAAGKNWLFFGEKTRDHHYYYKNFWEKLNSSGHLTLDLAFSRDQEEKIYVQHKMLERASKLWQWIAGGALLYVCGDASKMAKDVDAALRTIISEEGKLSMDEAKAYIKTLKKEKRYLRDVY